VRSDEGREVGGFEIRKGKKLRATFSSECESMRHPVVDSQPILRPGHNLHSPPWQFRRNWGYPDLIMAEA
jgi:hypothetical protein